MSQEDSKKPEKPSLRVGQRKVRWVKLSPKTDPPFADLWLKCCTERLKSKINISEEVVLGKGDEDNTYKSAIEACFRIQRFPIEIARPHRYTKIKSNLLGGSKKRKFMPAIGTSARS